MIGKVIAERAGPVARLVFDNPERRNAVSLEMWRTVEQALAESAADAAIPCKAAPRAARRYSGI
jgi:enoyl-CoA hydratase/carnithine racemase